MQKRSQGLSSPQGLYELFLATQPTRVLVVDEDPATREPLAVALRLEGYEVIEAAESADLYECLGQPLGSCNPQQLPELIIADVDMLDGTAGFDILAQLRAVGLNTPVILLMAQPDPEEHQQAARLGAAYLLSKRCDLDDVRYAALSLVLPR